MNKLVTAAIAYLVAAEDYTTRSQLAFEAAEGLDEESDSFDEACDVIYEKFQVNNARAVLSAAHTVILNAYLAVLRAAGETEYTISVVRRRADRDLMTKIATKVTCAAPNLSREIS